MVKGAVETIGPKITKTSVSLSRVFIYPITGRARIAKFVVGNPKGFESDFALKFKHFRIKIKSSTIFKDVIHIHELAILGPEIIYEYNGGSNNIATIQRNVENFTRSSSANKSPQKQDKSPKKVIIDHILVKGAKVHWYPKGLMVKPISLTLPDIHLKDIGKSKNGVMGADVFNKLLQTISFQITKQITSHGTEVIGNAKNAGEKIGKSFKKLFK